MLVYGKYECFVMQMLYGCVLFLSFVVACVTSFIHLFHRLLTDFTFNMFHNLSKTSIKREVPFQLLKFS